LDFCGFETFSTNINLSNTRQWAATSKDHTKKLYWFTANEATPIHSHEWVCLDLKYLTNNQHDYNLTGLLSMTSLGSWLNLAPKGYQPLLIYKQHVLTKLFLNKQITHNGLQSVHLDKYGQFDTLSVYVDLQKNWRIYICMFMLFCCLCGAIFIFFKFSLSFLYSWWRIVPLDIENMRFP
jgi:hypothetical protein